MTATLEKVQILKENGQDYEFYPTTDVMIEAVFHTCGAFDSMLDIGAGDGRVLEKIQQLCIKRAEEHPNSGFSRHFDKYAIEKSMVLIENMPPDISIVGTDFMLQALIDKKVDLIFCNPPYSEFEAWAVKIIKEANAKTIFLIIPDRWKDSKLIKRAIKQRKANYQTIWSGNFSQADRPARARVDIVKIVITTADRDYERGKTDPFDVWFDEYYNDFDKIKPRDKEDEYVPRSERPKREIVEGQNLVEVLADCYTKEMNNLLNNYKKLSQIDAALLKEIGVSIDEIKKALRLKIDGVKNKYWQELFDNLDKINKRLTSNSRKEIVEKMSSCCNVDFSVKNAYAVVIWVIKNANQYIDEQLMHIFKKLSEPECVKNYKSNIKTWEKDGWRYHKGDHSHYTLDYRIITHLYSAIERETSYSSYGYENGLARDCHDFINDIITIANNLGFCTASWENSLQRQWRSNKQVDFDCTEGRQLMAVRAFKNGNLHFKLDQKFIKTFNVEAARLLKWIKTPQEAADEMGYSVEFVKSCYRTNLLFGSSDGQKLLNGTK